MLKNDVTYALYLTEGGKETLIESNKDPRRIRRIAASKSMVKRSKKAECSLRFTRDGKDLRRDVLERLCLDLWFEDAENDMRE